MPEDQIVEEICTKEELFQKMSSAQSYFHALDLFMHSKQVVLSKSERVELLNLANNRLKELQIKGIQMAGDSDPYKKHFVK